MSQLLLRYGHSEGDILKLRVSSGERVTKLDAAGDAEAIQEVERILDIQQVTALLEADRMVLENSIRQVTLRQGELSWEVEAPTVPPEVSMRRNGADLSADPSSLPGLFVFPSSPVELGQSWEAVSQLCLRHLEQIEVRLRCTVTEVAQNGNVVVEMAQLGDLPASVRGRLEFSTAHGCMISSIVENQQSFSGHRWDQWTRIELLQRWGMGEIEQ